MTWTDFNSYSLSAKEAWERQEELNARDDQYICWEVCTKNSDDICYSEDEVNQMAVKFEADRIIYSIEKLNF